MRRDLYEPDHEAFREVVQAYVKREVTPNQRRWEQEHIVDRQAWLAAGKQAIIGHLIPERFGGLGTQDFRFRCVVMEEFARVGATSLSSGFGLQDDIAIPYLVDLGTEEQQARWLPPMAAGECIGAIAMTEPAAGSDLQGIRTTAVRDGDGWVLNGAKTFITNGINSDLVIVVARTEPDAGAHGISLLVVERGMPGFTRLLGREGGGFVHLMERLPRERLSIAILALTSVRAALGWTVDYTTQRTAFGKPLAAFQNTAFELASAVTEVDVLEAYLDKAVLALNSGELTAVDAAKAKLWATEVQHRVLDRCLQLFGGYGYMAEYPIARAYADARVQTIYGGTSEIMKTIIAREITGLRA
jgi:long-chain-acyl-CoA dehydrogenase